MSYNTYTFSISLGETYTGLTLSATLLDLTGTAVVTKINILTGFTEVGNGNYVWTYTQFESDFAGSVVFKNASTGVVLAVASINPDDAIPTQVVVAGESITLAEWYGTALQVIEDWVTSTTSTSTQWKRRFNLAVKYAIDNKMSFATSYTLTTSANVESWEVSPDPSADMDFIEFVALLTACNLHRTNTYKKSYNAASIRDGSSAIDTKGFGEKNLTISPCEQFESRYNAKYGSDIIRLRYNFANENNSGYDGSDITIVR